LTDTSKHASADHFRSVDSKVVDQSEYSGHYSFSSFGPVSTYVNRPGLHNRIKEQLHDCLAEPRPSAKILVVWGLGGAGKSQLVLNYLQEYRSDYSAAFWVEAGQRESLERDFLQIYRLLYGLKSAHGEEMVKIDDAVLAVKSWFQGRSGRWLLIFDSADNIDDKNDPGYIDLKHYLSDAPSIHIIITTRSSKARKMTRLPSVEVGSMELSEAVDLFSTCSECDGTAHEDHAKIEMIVQELGCLALAVTLAGSYVSETHLELSQYLEEYRQRRKELLGEVPKNLIYEYNESVLTTWESSFEAITQRNVHASSLLTVLAFIHYDDVMLDLFERARKGINTRKDEVREDGSANDQLLWQLAVSSQKPVDMYMIRQAFRVLESFSLVQWKKDQSSYAMHKLVHAWTYERLDRKRQETFCEAALKLLATAVRNWPPDPLYKARLIPHLMANFSTVSNLYRKMNSDNRSVLNLLDGIRNFLDSAGRWTEVCAVETFQLSQMEKLYGCEHVDTITAMSNLANTLGNLGKLDKAASITREVLEKVRRIFGDEHPNTIKAMNNLAVALVNQGKPDEATSIQREVLEKRRKIFGDEHLDTITAMNNFAITLSDLGKLNETASMRKEVLEKMRRILGDEHPHIIGAMNNLANTLSDLGKLDEAASMEREVLKKRRSILGDEHPDTLTAMSNLANTLGNLGKLDEAASMKREVLEKRRSILGDEHPDTLTVMSNLANTLGNLGKLDEAALIQRKVLEKRRKILGDEHPDILTAMSNLAITLDNLGKLDETASMEREVLEKRRRILGDEHPDTITAMSNLAITLGNLAKLDETASMEREVLEKRRRILGDEHPDTITAMSNLAITLGNLSKLDEAALIQRKVLEKRRKILGDEHPNTIIAMSNLAVWLAQIGDLDSAFTIFEDVLESRQRILGKAHPDTISASNNLRIAAESKEK
jgi:tetratricopeptide (TPR) repeat protein